MALCVGRKGHARVADSLRPAHLRVSPPSLSPYSPPFPSQAVYIHRARVEKAIVGLMEVEGLEAEDPEAVSPPAAPASPAGPGAAYAVGGPRV